MDLASARLIVIYWQAGLQDLWEHTPGYWQLVEAHDVATRKVQHISGVAFPVPTEIPLEAKLKNPQYFHKCTLETKSGYSSVAVAHLIKQKDNQALLKKIQVPYFADAVLGMKKSKKRSPKKSPKKKRAQADGDQDDEEAEGGMEGEAERRFTTPPKPKSKNRRLRASSSDPAASEGVKTPQGSGSALASA